MKLLKSIHYRKSLIFVLGVLLWELGHCSTQTLVISDGQRIEAAIAPDIMNRITVVNDRITNIFGDEGTFVTETDDQTGQMFIKPSSENGSKPLSLTLITENGVTQDLTLNPTDTAAATILLKNLSPAAHSNINDEDTHKPIKEATTIEQFVHILKQAVSGELPVYRQAVSHHRWVPCFSTRFLKAYQSGSYLITVWSVRNVAKDSEMQESLFYKPGDLAISFQDQSGKNSKKHVLYVLSRI